MKQVCQNCGGTELYAKTVSANGDGGPALLPLGWLAFAAFEVVVCVNCGLTEWYVPQRLLEKVKYKFQRVAPPKT